MNQNSSSKNSAQRQSKMRRISPPRQQTSILEQPMSDALYAMTSEPFKRRSVSSPRSVTPPLPQSFDGHHTTRPQTAQPVHNYQQQDHNHTDLLQDDFAAVRQRVYDFSRLLPRCTYKALDPGQTQAAQPSEPSSESSPTQFAVGDVPTTQSHPENASWTPSRKLSENAGDQLVNAVSGSLSGQTLWPTHKVAAKITKTASAPDDLLDQPYKVLTELSGGNTLVQPAAINKKRTIFRRKQQADAEDDSEDSIDEEIHVAPTAHPQTGFEDDPRALIRIHQKICKRTVKDYVVYPTKTFEGQLCTRQTPDREWAPAVFLYELVHKGAAAGLDVRLGLNGEQPSKTKPEGEDAFVKYDFTAYRSDQECWGPNRHGGRPNILLIYEMNDARKPYRGLSSTPVLTWDGCIVLGVDGFPIMDWANLPLVISSQIEGWYIDALKRQNENLGLPEIRARMPPLLKFDKSKRQYLDGRTTKEALNQRQNRDRVSMRYLPSPLPPKVLDNPHNRLLYEEVGAMGRAANTTRHLEDLGPGVAQKLENEVYMTKNDNAGGKGLSQEKRAKKKARPILTPEQKAEMIRASHHRFQQMGLGLADLFGQEMPVALGSPIAGPSSHYQPQVSPVDTFGARQEGSWQVTAETIETSDTFTRPRPWQNAGKDVQHVFVDSDGPPVAAARDPSDNNGPVPDTSVRKGKRKVSEAIPEHDGYSAIGAENNSRMSKQRRVLMPTGASKEAKTTTRASKEPSGKLDHPGALQGSIFPNIDPRLLDNNAVGADTVTDSASTVNPNSSAAPTMASSQKSPSPASSQQDGRSPSKLTAATAEAVAEFLAEHDSNSAMRISLQSIASLLDRAEPFADFVRNLKERGLVFDEGKLAQCVLSRLQELCGPQQTTRKRAHEDEEVGGNSVALSAPNKKRRTDDHTVNPVDGKGRQTPMSSRTHAGDAVRAQQQPRKRALDQVENAGHEDDQTSATKKRCVKPAPTGADESQLLPSDSSSELLEAGTNKATAHSESPSEAQSSVPDLLSNFDPSSESDVNTPDAEYNFANVYSPKLAPVEDLEGGWDAWMQMEFIE